MGEPLFLKAAATPIRRRRPHAHGGPTRQRNLSKGTPPPARRPPDHEAERRQHGQLHQIKRKAGDRPAS